jgi:hypothetical protein
LVLFLHGLMHVNPNRIKIVKNYKTFSSNHEFFYKISSSF